MGHCQLGRKIIDAELDVLHIPHCGRSAPPIAFSYLSKRIKLVVTNHGMAHLALPANRVYTHPLSPTRFIDYKEFLKWGFVFKDRVHLIVTVSKSEKQLISRSLSITPDKIRVIYHGIDEEFRPLDREDAREELSRKYGISSPFILHVSSYQLKKNVHRVIAAFKKLRECGDEFKRYKLVIVGNHPREVREFARDLGLGDAVVFTGFVDKEDLPKFYSAVFLFIFPSLHESFGLPILEAMACGCPVITSNVFAMPEIAEDAAILVNPYNINEIADAMHEVLTNSSLREELRKKGIERAKKFSWRRTAEEYLKVYKEVVEERNT